MDRFKQIETFVRVAEAGSLAAAALEEGVSPVILGRRIDALEKRLGVKLMYRSTRRLVVSEEGAAFLERCKQPARGLGPGGKRARGGAARGERPSDRVGAGGVRAHARRAARAAVRARQARIAGFVQSDRPRRRSGARRLRPVDSHRRRGRSELRRREAGEQPARRLRHARIFQASTASRKRWKICRVTIASRSICRAGRTAAGISAATASSVTVRVAGNLDCNDGELLHRWASEGSGSAGAPPGKSSGNWQRASSKPCWTNSRCPTTTSSRFIRSSGTCRRGFATSLIILRKFTRNPVTGVVG